MVSHNAAISWVKDAENRLLTVVYKAIAGIIAIVIGDRSAETFKPLWQIVQGWPCFFYVTDGYVVYPQFPRGC